MEKSLIEIRGLCKDYIMGDEIVHALDSIRLDIKEGEICCIFGESGSGKSTLLNQMAALEKPTKGGVRIGGQILSLLNEKELALFRQKNIGFVFQSYNLIPTLSALENVAMPLMFAGMQENKRNKLAADMLKEVGLSDRMHHLPSQMSGGQQQRVGIARAFVSRPQVIFADEPTGNLDSKSSREIMELMAGFCRKYHLTLIMVSHDPKTAAYADHIVELLDGKIVREQYCLERDKYVNQKETASTFA